MTNEADMLTMDQCNNLDKIAGDGEHYRLHQLPDKRWVAQYWTADILPDGWSKPEIFLLKVQAEAFIGRMALAMQEESKRYHHRLYGASAPWPARPRLTGNSAFDAYREEELKALDLRRQKLDFEVYEFAEYQRYLEEENDRELFNAYRQGRAK